MTYKIYLVTAGGLAGMTIALELFSTPHQYCEKEIVLSQASDSQGQLMMQIAH